MNDIYITKTSHFLPNDPINNDEMETYLGKICDKGSRAKKLVLRNNRIINRHYAMNQSGHVTHTNAELTVEAVNLLFDESLAASELELLAVGTSSPDILMPNHGLLVHSLIPEVNSIPVYTAAGVCCSGMHALETAYRSLLFNDKVKNGIATGSELLSPLLKSDFFELELHKLLELKENAVIAFEKDFLRFMLSDGAGAFLLEKKPRKGLSYKIEWVESISYANQLPTCMYQGCIKNEDGSLKSWKMIEHDKWDKESIFSIKQDTRILENIIPFALKFMVDAFEKHQLDSKTINYFLPHISSMYFYDKLVNGVKDHNLDIPEHVFYCCLPEIGNIGSASIYATLDILTKEQPPKEGELIVLGVPESAQFQYSLALLRATYN